MRFGKRDLFVADVFLDKNHVLVGSSEDDFSDIDESENSDVLSEMVSETLNGIVLSGPFAGPFVVEIVRYTGSFGTQYFWNGRRMLRKELYLCGSSLPKKRVFAILDALKQGVQSDNSTVPMLVVDLLSGRDVSNHDMGEPTMRFLNR
jgi:hypothetical protein